MGLAVWDGGTAVSEKGSDVTVEPIGIAYASDVGYETKKKSTNLKSYRRESMRRNSSR